MNTKSGAEHEWAGVALAPRGAPSDEFLEDLPAGIRSFKQFMIQYAPLDAKELNNQVTSILTSTGKENTMYIPVAIVLNIISRAYWTATGERMKPIVWLVNPSKPLPGDIFSTLVQPDIVSTVCTSADLDKYLEAIIKWQGGPSYPDIAPILPSHAMLASPVEVKTCVDYSVTPVVITAEANTQVGW